MLLLANIGVILSLLQNRFFWPTPPPGTRGPIRYLVLLFLMHQMAIGLFRTIGAIGRTMVISNTFGSFALLILFVLGGFILSKDKIPDWWIWGFWISPLSYAQNAIAVNEFLADRWRIPSPNAPLPLYLSILTNKGMYHEAYWYDIGVWVLIAYTFFFNFTLTLALKYLKPLGKQQTMLPEKVIDEKHEARTGGQCYNQEGHVCNSSWKGVAFKYGDGDDDDPELGAYSGFTIIIIFLSVCCLLFSR